MNKNTTLSKPALLLIFLLNVLLSFAQKKDSLPAGVYYWNKTAGIKEESRLRKEVVEGSTRPLLNGAKRRIRRIHTLTPKNSSS